MIFSVVYAPSAERELAEAWLQAGDRKAVEDASNTIDRLLRLNAHQRGQPFFGDRILVVRPLVVFFSVSIDDRMATVLQIQTMTP